jgi:hypothetical protein
MTPNLKRPRDRRAVALILTPQEVASVTRRDRPKAQARVLRALGIPFRVHPRDSVLIVSVAAVQAALGLQRGSEIDGDGDADTSGGFEVNVEGIRSHGKTATVLHSG